MKRAIMTCVILAGTSLFAVACSNAKPADGTHNSPVNAEYAVAGCATGAAYDGAGMLSPDEVWPGTPELSQGYLSATFTESNCTNSNQLPTRPVCASQFPWLAESEKDPDGILFDGGIRQVFTGIIQGNHPVANGAVNVPQEIDEKVFLLDDDAGHNFLLRFASTCGRPFVVNNVTAYKMSVLSIDLKHEVTAVFVAVHRSLFWIEFNAADWKPGEYLSITKDAIETATDLHG
jgi:hypothetical protein